MAVLYSPPSPATLAGRVAGIGRSTRYLKRLKHIVKTEIAEDDPASTEFIKDMARVELDVPVYVHREDEQLTTTGKAFGKNEKPIVPYLRYRHAYKLMGHLMSAGGRPKPVQTVTTFSDEGPLDVPGKPRAIHTPRPS